MAVIEHPGCYGLPTAVSATSPSCRDCPSRGGCVYEAFLLLDSLPVNPLTQRERLTLTVTRQALAASPRARGRAVVPPLVVASSRGVKRIALNQEQLAHVAALPAKVASQVKKLLERGWFEFAKGELRAGRNPASKGWQRILCAHLLTGGATRTQLELALVTELQISPPSARVQLSVGIAIFAAGRLAIETFGQVKLLPN